jgi:hypothetical protein
MLLLKYVLVYGIQLFNLFKPEHIIINDDIGNYFENFAPKVLIWVMFLSAINKLLINIK